MEDVDALTVGRLDAEIEHQGFRPASVVDHDPHVHAVAPHGGGQHVVELVPPNIAGHFPLGLRGFHRRLRVGANARKRYQRQWQQKSNSSRHCDTPLDY